MSKDTKNSLMYKIYTNLKYQPVTNCKGFNISFTLRCERCTNYVQIVYNLCTIFRVISYNYQRVTASNMYNCLQACFFGVFTKSKKRSNRMFFTPLVSYRDRTCLRILFFVGFSTYIPYRENTFSLQGENIILAGRKHYPCREKTLPLQGEQAIDVMR